MRVNRGSHARASVARTAAHAARLAAAGLLLLAPPAAAQQGGARFDGVRDSIRAMMARQHVQGVGVAVAEHGRIVWEEGFGWADRAHMVPATANTMFSLASISKPFAAAGLMTLVEAGRVNLDAPANDYLAPTGQLTGLAAPASEATVWRVLSHTAGLPLHWQFFYEDGGYAAPDMDVTIAHYGNLVNPPGHYEYSNLGYGIIGHIIARVSGQPYEDYMRTHVFLPLGLTHTEVVTSPPAGAEYAARYEDDGTPVPWYDFDHRAASAVYSSAHDLVRLGMFELKDHLAGQAAILPDSDIDAMHRQRTTESAEQGYALGWFIERDHDGYRRYSHTGGMPGVSTVLSLFPTEDLAVVVLSNASAIGVTRIADQIAGIMLPRLAAERAKRAPLKAAPPPAYTTPAELAGTWTGTVRTWQDVVPLTLVFQPDGDVHVKLGEQTETLLGDPRWKDGELTGELAGTIPTPDARRHPGVIRLDLHLRGARLSGEASAISPGDGYWYALTSYANLGHQ